MSWERLLKANWKTGPQGALPRHGAFYIAAGIGGVALVLGFLLASKYAIGIGADAMFVTYLGLTAWEFRCLTPEFLRRRAADADTPVGAIFLVTVLVVAATVTLLFLALNQGDEIDPYAIAAGAASLVLGWFTVHTLAALHYAYEYYEVPEASGDNAGGNPVGGLEFPGADPPDGSAFLYFSYVVGMTAQVADVAVASNAMRRMVTLHGVFSFFFNTVILAAAVNLIVTIAGR